MYRQPPNGIPREVEEYQSNAINVECAALDGHLYIDSNEVLQY